jgi:AcrR family transcriptional regulator
LHTSTRQSAEACGISKGNLYHYIKSKDDFLDLFVEMTTSSFDELSNRIRRQLLKTSPASSLTEAIKESLKLADVLQDMILFWYHESKNHDSIRLRKLMKQDLHTVDLFKTIIEAGCQQGDFKVSDPMLAAFNIMMLCDMWSLKRWYIRKHYTLETYTAKCQEIALAIALGSQRSIPTSTKSR